MKEYRDVAESDAADCLTEFLDQIVSSILEDQTVPTDPINTLDGFDEYHHETHVDKEYDLGEAAQLLEELSRYEETDTGLWDGSDPRTAISSQATYTYGNAVLWLFIAKLNELEDDADLKRLGEAYDLIDALDDDAGGADIKAAIKKEVERRVREAAE